MHPRTIKLTITGVLIGAIVGGIAAWVVTKSQERRLSPELGSGRELSLQNELRSYIPIARALVTLVRNAVVLFSLPDE